MAVPSVLHLLQDTLRERPAVAASVCLLPVCVGLWITSRLLRRPRKVTTAGLFTSKPSIVTQVPADMLSSAYLDFDVAIIGAGISGINSAYRVQTQGPKGTSYAILESRNSIGGTWDFFKYPGLRSDSDLHTFGFAWRPWTEGKAIATAPTIMKYLNDSVKSAGIDKHIRFGHKLVAADWCSQQMCWSLKVNTPQGQKTFNARFIILGTGYYNYDEPLDTVIPGIENFKGKVIHPQFWPQDYDYTGKNMVIIGSGATAVTLVPNVQEKVKTVTMLQRSPSYVFSLAMKDPVGKFLHAIMPSSWASTLDRWRWICAAYFFFWFCRAFPGAAKNILKTATSAQLPKNIPWDPHFKPAYNPWEQRLCLCPDGDFYKALRKGNANIVTDKIKTVTANSIELQSGNRLQPDVIVTATGLKMLMAGGTQFTVDGTPLDVPAKYMWKGVMLQDLPNCAFVVGYTNASWTLGADATAVMVCRLMRYMRDHKVLAAVPRTLPSEKMESTPMLNLNSTYIQRAVSVMPKSGTGQWAPRSNYFSDMSEARRGDILTNLQLYTQAVPAVQAQATKPQPSRYDSAIEVKL